MKMTPSELFRPALRDLTVLAVYAHPDDESYLAAGLMAAVTGAGGRVVHATATLGEHGTADPEAFPPDRMAAHRRWELTTALAAVGVRDSVVFGYPDGGCADVDDRQATRTVARLINAVRPDVVVTFGPDGITGHPDHIATGRWTAAAVESTGDRAALFVSASDLPADLEAKMADAGAYMPGYERPTSLTAPIELDLGDRLLSRKLGALAAHASQTEGVRAFMGDIDYRRLAAYEAFRPANDAAHRMLAPLQRRAA